MIHHLDVFILMEEEMMSISIPTRPKTPQDYAKEKLEEKYGKAIGAEECKKMNKLMQGAKKGQPSDNQYINMKTCVDWRAIPSKSVSRDWARYIIAIILEPILVPKYHPELLTDSPAAAYLRAMAHTLLSNHCRRRNTLGGDKQGYIFVDCIDMPKVTPQKPIIDVELAIVNRERQSNLLTMRQELTGVIGRFEKLRGVVARPGSNLMADEIKDAFDIVVEVSFPLIISYYY